MHNKGFTIIELLIVIAVLVLLVLAIIVGTHFIVKFW